MPCAKPRTWFATWFPGGDLPPRLGSGRQVRFLGGGVLPEVAHLEPQGLHLRGPVGAQGLVVCPTASLDNAMLVGASGTRPGTALDPGERGPHYMGSFKISQSRR